MTIIPFMLGWTHLAGVKWLPELDVDKRMEVDYIWIKFVFVF